MSININGRAVIRTHRDSDEIYEVEFTPASATDPTRRGQLSEDDSVASVASVTVKDEDGNDLTTEYIGSTTNTGNVVSFNKKAAADTTKQTVDRLELEVKVNTAEGQVAVWQDAKGKVPVLIVEQ